jgi:hypothetical protein
MDDERFDDVIRSLPRDFNVPPRPPLDEMWSVIQDAHFNAPASSTRPRGLMANAPWLAAAATLLIGIGIGRYMSFTGSHVESASDRAASSIAPRSTAIGAQASTDTSAVADAYRDQTNHYLGQAAALLIALPTRNGSAGADAAFSNKAADLLVTTRLLIDSPAASQDPKLHSLLEDLELVLVQIARLHGERSKGDLDLIHQAVEQGDVISRLNSAVATTQSSE